MVLQPWWCDGMQWRRQRRRRLQWRLLEHEGVVARARQERGPSRLAGRRLLQLREEVAAASMQGMTVRRLQPCVRHTLQQAMRRPLALR